MGRRDGHCAVDCRADGTPSVRWTVQADRAPEGKGRS